MENIFKTTALFSDYLFWINGAQDLDRLDSIVERAAFDDTLTDAEYCKIVEKAQEKAKIWALGRV